MNSKQKLELNIKSIDEKLNIIKTSKLQTLSPIQFELARQNHTESVVRQYNLWNELQSLRQQIALQQQENVPPVNDICVARPAIQVNSQDLPVVAKATVVQEAQPSASQKQVQKIESVSQERDQLIEVQALPHQSASESVQKQTKPIFTLNRPHLQQEQSVMASISAISDATNHSSGILPENVQSKQGNIDPQGQNVNQKQPLKTIEQPHLGINRNVHKISSTTMQPASSASGSTLTTSSQSKNISKGEKIFKSLGLDDSDSSTGSHDRQDQKKNSAPKVENDSLAIFDNVNNQQNITRIGQPQTQQNTESTIQSKSPLSQDKDEVLLLSDSSGHSNKTNQQQHSSIESNRRNKNRSQIDDEDDFDLDLPDMSNDKETAENDYFVSSFVQGRSNTSMRRQSVQRKTSSIASRQSEASGPQLQTSDIPNTSGSNHSGSTQARSLQRNNTDSAKVLGTLRIRNELQQSEANPGFLMQSRSVKQPSGTSGLVGRQSASSSPLQKSPGPVPGSDVLSVDKPIKRSLNTNSLYQAPASSSGPQISTNQFLTPGSSIASRRDTQQPSQGFPQPLTQAKTDSLLNKEEEKKPQNIENDSKSPIRKFRGFLKSASMKQSSSNSFGAEQAEQDQYSPSSSLLRKVQSSRQSDKDSNKVRRPSVGVGGKSLQNQDRNISSAPPSQLRVPPGQPGRIAGIAQNALIFGDSEPLSSGNKLGRLQGGSSLKNRQALDQDEFDF